MMKSLGKLALAGSVTLSVAYSPDMLFNRFSNTANAALSAVKSPNLVYLSKKSSVKLQSAIIVSNDDKDQLVIRLRVFNNEKKSLDMLNYWFRLKDKQAKNYNIKLVQPEQTKAIASGSYLDLVYVADVGTNRKAEEFNVVCVKWDFSVANYERTIGTIVTPKGYSKLIPSASTANFEVGATTIKSTIKSSQRYTQNDVDKYQLVLSMTNTGKWGTTFGADAVFYVQTAAGYIYPLKPKDEVTTLLPQQTKNIELTGEIPKDVKLTRANLFFGVKDSKTNTLIPYLTYQLPAAGTGNGTELSDSDAVQLGKEIKFAIDDQVLNLKGEQIYRYPDQGNDWLSVSFKINNPTKNDIKMPAIEAAVGLNGISVDNKPMILTGGNSLIKANSEQEIFVLIPLSYKETYSTVTVELKSKDELGTQSIGKVKTSIPSQIKIDGKSLNQQWNSYDQTAQYNIKQAYAYEGTRTDLLVAELDYKNTESRLAGLKSLGAFMINNAGDIYPATVQTPDKAQLKPNGTGKVFITTEIPKDVALDGFRLILGENITSGEQKAFYNPVAVQLTLTQAETDDLIDMPVGTDLISIKHLLAQVVDGSRFRLDFDYDFVEGLNSYEWSTGERKLIVQLVDRNGATYEKTISLSEATGDHFEYGKGKIFTTSFDDDQFFMKVPSFLAYTLNVYEQYGDHKRLIGSEFGEWMVRNSY